MPADRQNGRRNVLSMMAIGHGKSKRRTKETCQFADVEKATPSPTAGYHRGQEGVGSFEIRETLINSGAERLAMCAESEPALSPLCLCGFPRLPPASWRHREVVGRQASHRD